LLALVTLGLKLLAERKLTQVRGDAAQTV